MNRYVDLLEQTPRLVRNIVSLAHDIDRKKGDFFSIRENVAHLRDIDILGYAVRVRRVLEEENPSLADVPGDKLAIERQYATLAIEPELADFEISRASSMELLLATPDAMLERSGELEGVGRVTLRDLLVRWIEHDQGHLEEMRGLME